MGAPVGDVGPQRSGDRVAIATDLGPDITRRGSHVASMKCLGGSDTPAAESPVGAYTQYRMVVIFSVHYT